MGHTQPAAPRAEMLVCVLSGTFSVDLPSDVANPLSVISFAFDSCAKFELAF